jgi:hypothetical protein
LKWLRKITVKCNGYELNNYNKIGNEVGNFRCLIHIDRLSITFKHCSGSTFNDVRNPEHIQFEQTYKKITLIYDNSPGLGAYYHSYKVFYKGISVGRMHAATKLKKHEIQFDFAKEVFYSFYPEFWYEVYSALKKSGVACRNGQSYGRDVPHVIVPPIKSSTFGRTIKWRGIKYKLVSAENTIRLN